MWLYIERVYKMKKKKWYLITLIISILGLISCKQNDNEEVSYITESNQNMKVYEAETYDSWNEAYKNIIINANLFLLDLSDPDNIRDDELSSESLYIYLRLHDFDNDKIPELVLSDGISVGVFTYETGYVKRIADIYVDEVPWSANGGHYSDNCIYFQCDGSDGSYYLCWTYYEGEFLTGIYDDYMPTMFIVDGVETSYENFNTIFNFNDMKEVQKNRIGYFILDKDANTLQVARYDVNGLKEGEVVNIDNILKEDFDMEKSDATIGVVNVAVKRDEIFYKTDNTGTGIVMDIDNLAWLALRYDEIINCGEISEKDNEYIQESNMALTNEGDVIQYDSKGYWVRIENNIVMPLPGTTVTGHKDYMMYVDETEAYLAIQSPINLEMWSLYKLPGYGDWLKKEIDIILRKNTGL